jgi:branched-chain amino acid transport system ATP-binding protein
MLAASGLTKSFGGLRAVDSVALQLGRGEIVGLVGPNGAGKTTLFNLLAGTLRSDSGTIRLAGQDITGLRPQKRLGKGLGRTFQIPRPFAEMTVLENVLVGAQGQAGENLFANFLARGKVRAHEQAAEEKARELIDFVTLARLADQPARVLSGGQRKLLELARILMADPAVLLLDEPAAGVNPALLETISERIAAINQRGVTVLVIEHNIQFVRDLCPRTAVMAAGRMIADGPTDASLGRKDVAEAYLGEAA